MRSKQECYKILIILVVTFLNTKIKHTVLGNRNNPHENSLNVCFANQFIDQVKISRLRNNDIEKVKRASFLHIFLT